MPRRLLALACGLALAGFALAPGQAPDPGGPPAEGVPVELALADGSKVAGTLPLAALRFGTAYGSAAVDAGKLRRVELIAGDAGPVFASVTLADKTHLDGPLLTDPIPVRVGDRTEQYRPADVRSLTFPRPRETSLWAVVLGLLTLTLMEVVLGVDNVIFLAIVSAKLPAQRQPSARRIGLLAALGTRLLLLASLSFLLGLTRPIFTLPALPFLQSAEARGISWRDVILLAGGLFLIGKSVFEMHEKLEHAKAQRAGKPAAAAAAGFARVIVQIAVIDIVFSLDSVITAVGMVEELWVMVAAMLAAVGVMMAASGPIARFVDRRPTVKVLALSFLVLIGVMLVAEGLGQHIDKGYIYFAMAFAVGVELVNMRLRGSPSPVAGELPGG